MSKMWIIFGALSLALAMPWAIPAMAQTPSATPQAQADDRILGKADAPVTVFEYASLTCPHCADFDENTLPQIKRDWIDTGKVRLIFRDFPLDIAAVRGAMLARCAPPEQFFAFLDVLFRGQESWGHYDEPNQTARADKADQSLSKYAKLAGMSDDVFKACTANTALQQSILNERIAGERQYGVESTPTFFINGVKFEGAQPYAAFQKALTAAAGKQ